jgi:hypothetical protein
MDPTYNKGPLFWYKLSGHDSVLSDLEEPYVLSKAGRVSSLPGDVLFGMAQMVTGMKPSYVDRLLEYVTEAARTGFSPARALYAQIISAHRRTAEFDEITIDKWTLNAIAEGYLFAKPSSRLNRGELDRAKQLFRNSGGFCTDPFLRKQDILKIARDNRRVGEWNTERQRLVDHKGNTILHVAAALGVLESVKVLVEDVGIPVDVEGDNQETPLYKACKGGHPDVVHYLLDKGAKSSGTTEQEKVTALHWLFTFPQASVRGIAIRLVQDGGASVNATIVPSVGENGGSFPRKMSILHL